jgi:hypothetical protein
MALVHTCSTGIHEHGRCVLPGACVSIAAVLYARAFVGILQVRSVPACGVVVADLAARISIPAHAPPGYVSRALQGSAACGAVHSHDGVVRQLLPEVFADTAALLKL